MSYTENFFDSIGIIVDAKLKTLDLERTWLCRIVGTEDRNQGKYKVKYENTEFIANCADSSYGLGDLVYVGGIHSNGAQLGDAFIISKKLTNAQTVKKLNPFEDFVPMMEYCTNKNVVYKIDSNSSENDEIEFENTPQVGESLNNYDYLGVEATFISNITTNPNKDSYYGLTLYIKTKENNGGQDYYSLYTKTFTSKDMLVINPFVFEGELKQRYLFDIKNINNIVDIHVVFSGHNILLVEDQEIGVKNITISYGQLFSEHSKPILQLYTETNNMNYSASNNEARKMYLKWVYKEEEAIKIITYSNKEDFEKQNAELYLERFVNNEWEVFSSSKNFIYTTDKFSPLKESDKYRCRIIYHDISNNQNIEYQSNELVFVNQDKVPNMITYLSLNSENLDFIDLYDNTGRIIDNKLINNNYQAVASIRLNSDLLEKLYTTLENSKCELQYIWSASNIENSMLNFADNALDTINIHELTFNKNNPMSSLIEITLPFSIKDYYVPSLNNNDITITTKFYFNNNLIQTESQKLNFNFKKSGICENDYIMHFTIFDNENKNLYYIIPGQQVSIKGQVYDPNGNLINTEKDFEWEWYSKPVTQDFINLKNSNDSNICGLYVQASLPEDTKDLFYILQGRYIIKNKYGTPVKEVIGYLPIAIKNENSQIATFSGPTSVVYNSNGSMPKYYQSAYKAYDNNGEIIQLDLISYIQNQSSYDNELYPQIVQNVLGDWELSVNNLYIKEAVDNFGIIGYSPLNGKIEWIQPIIIYQQNSFSSYINDWDGSFKIDEKNNAMMSARLGAGKKNEDGTFSGVLLGDWREKIEDKSIATTGVYGFDHGKGSYGLREDGSAFLGKSGSGRINFNGDLGLIYSGNFNGTFYKANETVVLNKNTWRTYQGKYDIKYFNSDDQLVIDERSFIQFSKIITIINVPETDEPQEQMITNVPAIQINNPTNNQILVEYSLIIDSIEYRDSGKNPRLSEEDELVFKVRKQGNENNIYYEDSTNQSSGVTYKSIGQTKLPEDKEHKVKLYSNGKITIKLILPANQEGIQESRLNLLPIWYIPNAKYSDGCSINLTIHIDEIKLTSLKDETEYSIDTLLENKDVVLAKPADIGTNGTFIDLKEGQFITNGGIFRGNLEVESLTLLNEIVIGDPGNSEGRPWIRITPEGGLYASTIDKKIKYTKNQNDVTSINIGESIVYDDSSNNYYHIIKPENDETSSYYYIQLTKVTPKNN